MVSRVGHRACNKARRGADDELRRRVSPGAGGHRSALLLVCCAAPRTCAALCWRPAGGDAAPRHALVSHTASDNGTTLPSRSSAAPFVASPDPHAGAQPQEQCATHAGFAPYHLFSAEAVERNTASLTMRQAGRAALAARALRRTRAAPTLRRGRRGAA